MSKRKIGICECGSNRRYVARQKSVLGETLYFVRCPYCKREAGASLNKSDAIEFWNDSYGRNDKAVNGKDAREALRNLSIRKDDLYRPSGRV